MKKISKSFLILIVALSLFSSISVYGDANEPVLESPFKSGVTTVPELIKFVVEEIILPLGALVAAFFIIYGGFLLVTARGDTGKIKQAKSVLTGAIIGTVILLGAYSIARVFQGTICSIVGEIDACNSENQL